LLLSKLKSIFAVEKLATSNFNAENNGNTRDKAKLNFSHNPTPLRLETRQKQPFAMSIPRRQNTEYAGVLQNAYGLLF
jgi:hypothetical protein